MGRERLAAFESVPSCGLGYFGRVEYMLVSIPPSTFLDEVHRATLGSSFDETGNFYCISGDRIDGWDFDRFDRFAPTEPERLGGVAGYRYVGPLGPSSQAAIESCYTHRGQRFGYRLYGHCPTLALVG